MIDADLERRTADCVELIDAWRMFLELVNRAVKPPKTVTPQLEQQFLASKARIAMLHDSFMDSLKHDRNTGQNMLEIVNRAITLRQLEKMTEAERKKMELEWHESFLLLNETVTTLNEERARLAEINEFAHNMKKMQERLFVNIKSILNSFYFKFMVAVIVIVGGLALLKITPADDWLRDLGALHGVVVSYQNFMRGIGFEMPYDTIQAFEKDLPTIADHIDGINEVQKEPTDVKEKMESARDKISGAIARGDQTALQAMRDPWGKAQQFTYYAYMSKRSGNQRDQAMVYLFYFKTNTDARALETQLRLYLASSQNQTIQVHRKANIIVIVQSNQALMLDKIKSGVLDKVKPY